MKKTILFSLALLAGVILSSNVYAQATVIANAKATIVRPISISSTGGDLNFGNITVSASSGGTVKLDPSSNTRTASGGVTLPSQAGTVQTAIFEVKGVAGYTFTVNVPTNLTLNSGSNTMTISNIEVSPSSGYQLDGNGNKILKVGGTLNVGANQAEGEYQTTASAFTVTVAYD